LRAAALKLGFVIISIAAYLTKIGYSFLDDWLLGAQDIQKGFTGQAL
jgi:hypothetical protein